jgi:glutamate racemase
VLATEATVASDSYGIELRKLAPRIRLVQQACPLWVPLVEAGELDGPGTEYFLRKALAPLLPPQEAPARVLLGCTHYPLLLPALRRILSPNTEILDQGALVAERLADWMRRHPEQEVKLARAGTRRFCTTDDAEWFSARGGKLLGTTIRAERVRLRD